MKYSDGVCCSSIIHVLSRKCACSRKGLNPIEHIFISISGCGSDNSIKQFNMLYSGVDRFTQRVVGSLIN
jgi:hypothetical protein